MNDISMPEKALKFLIIQVSQERYFYIQIYLRKYLDTVFLINSRWPSKHSVLTHTAANTHAKYIHILL